jgi:hypothetical protein
MISPSFNISVWKTDLAALFCLFPVQVHGLDREVPVAI